MPDIVVSENVAGPAMTELRQRFDVALDPDLRRDRDRLFVLVSESTPGLMRALARRIERETADENGRDHRRRVQRQPHRAFQRRRLG
jgi:hypothetical protein